MSEHLTRQLNDSCEHSKIEMLRFCMHLIEMIDGFVENNQENRQLILRVQEYINEHFAEDIHRDNIASAVFVAPNHLSKVFKSQTGQSLREYLTAVRLKKARQLLLSSGLSVADIALETGFENITYFSTVFKKNCGVTPAEWRSGKR